jgi:hypothetical protein
MKLHNLLLSVILFFFVGTAFAQNPNAPGQQKKNNDDFVAPFDLVSFDSYALDVVQQEGYKATSTLNVTRIRMNGHGGGANGWSYYAGGYTSNDVSSLEEKLLFQSGTKVDNPDYSTLLSGLSADEIKAIEHFADSHEVYQFSFTFDDKVKEIGLIGTQGSSAQQEVPTIQNTPNDPGNQFYFLGDTGVLYYGGSNLYANNGAMFIVSLNTTYTPSDPLPQQGQPLPAPVTTLLIALAFGGAFVMYRNRKQVKA